VYQKGRTYAAIDPWITGGCRPSFVKCCTTCRATIGGAIMIRVEAIVRNSFLNPATLSGALFYAAVFLLFAWMAAAGLRLAVKKVLQEDVRGLIDRTAATFLQQLARIAIYVVALILYAHLVPALRSLGTALLTGASVASIVVGLAAQSTLGSLIAGISLVLYRPFEIGDRVQVSAPTGVETGIVERLTLGYTILTASDNRRVVVPNSAMASQIAINLGAKDRR
jgi:small conductance mechanosensitive channel